MAGSMGLREDLYQVTVIIAGTDGKKCKFVFDKMQGGDVSAKATKYRAANGTRDEIVLGGGKTVSDITVRRLEDYTVYLWVSWLMDQAGKADAYVAKQPLDNDGNPYGKALNYSGKLITVKPSDTDSESDSASLLELGLSVSTPVATG